MTKSNNDWLDEILDKNLEDIVDANFNGYNYALNKTAKAAITAKINEIVDTIIGDDVRGCKLHETPSDFCSSGSCLAASAVNDEKAIQRKRKDEVLR